MRKLGLIAALSASLFGFQTNASEFAISLNDETVSTAINAAITPEASVFAHFIYSEPNGELYEFGSEIVSSQGVHTLGIGGKYLFLSVDSMESASALAFTSHYRLDLAPLVSFRVEGSYSPAVLSFGDMQHYMHLDASVNILVMPTVELYGGWRQISFDFDDVSDEYEYEEGAYLGARFTF